MVIFDDIESLIYYASEHLLLDELDIALVRNQLLDMLALKDYVISELDYAAIEDIQTPSVLLEPITSYAVEHGIIKDSDKSAFASKIMSVLSKKPSEIADIFAMQQKRSPSKATQWLHDYMIHNGYIEVGSQEPVRHWEAKGTKGKIEISVAKDTAHKTGEAGTYPLCDYCIENEGYAPNNNHNLRTLPLSLAGEDWFMQYTKVGYYSQEALVVSSSHKPLVVGKELLARLFDFNDYLPNYFVCSDIDGHLGSNAHEHFDAGHKLMPLFNAPDRRHFKAEGHPLVDISEVEWYSNCIRAISLDRHRLEAFGSEFIARWQEYSDTSIGLDNGDAKTNSMAISVRRDKQDRYVIELIIRSIAKSEQYPNGIFNVHSDRVAIKGNSVSALDSLGFFILPSRLNKELVEIERFLTKDSKLTTGKSIGELDIHRATIEKLIKEQGASKPSPLEATLNLKDEINVICETSLVDSAVFKQDKSGVAALDKFFGHIGLIEKKPR